MHLPLGNLLTHAAVRKPGEGSTVLCMQFAGATFIVLHVEITMASIYMRNKYGTPFTWLADCPAVSLRMTAHLWHAAVCRDMIRALAPLDLTGGMASTIQYCPDTLSLDLT